jgi:hypothetical protein
MNMQCVDIRKQSFRDYLVKASKDIEGRFNGRRGEIGEGVKFADAGSQLWLVEEPLED